MNIDTVNTPHLDKVSEPTHASARALSTSCWASRLWHENITLVAAASLLVCSIAGRAQSLTVSWFKIAGGGGTCVNGELSVSGTIGQHDAGGPMTNGLFSVSGGFWTALQFPSAPTLRITQASPGYLTISWSPNTPCWRLQETLSLAGGHWVDSPSGTANPVTVPTTSPTKFYRLIHP